MGSANERRRYIVTPSLIGLAHAQNDPCRVHTTLNEKLKNNFTGKKCFKTFEAHKKNAFQMFVNEIPRRYTNIRQNYSRCHERYAG